MIKIKNIWNQYKELREKKANVNNNTDKKKQNSLENKKTTSLRYHRNYGTFTEHNPNYTDETKKEVASSTQLII